MAKNRFPFQGADVKGAFSLPSFAGSRKKYGEKS
jgi:hypothetical protein